MKAFTSIFFMALMGLFIIPATVVLADTVVRTGDTVSIDKDQKIEGDFYTMANVLSISGEVTNDLIVVGGEVTVNGPVAYDVLVAGGNVDIHGTVGDDLRVIGGNVVIAEPIAGDVFVFGGKVSVLSTATIGGDLLVYGGDVEVNGVVSGDIVGDVDTLRVDAPVAGNIDVTTGTLVIGDRADISGSVRYVSDDVLTRSQNAKITGEVTRNDPVIDASKANAKMVLVPILIVLFSSLVWYMVARPVLTHIVERALTRSIRPTLIGLFVFFVAPLIVVILMVSMLGILVGMATFFAYLLLMLLALVSSSVVLGQFIMDQFRKEKGQPLTPLTLAIGVCAMMVCIFVPIIGPLVLLALFILTLGATADVLLRLKVT